MEDEGRNQTDPREGWWGGAESYIKHLLDHSQAWNTLQDRKMREDEGRNERKRVEEEEEESLDGWGLRPFTLIADASAVS